MHNTLMGQEANIGLRFDGSESVLNSEWPKYSSSNVGTWIKYTMTSWHAAL